MQHLKGILIGLCIFIASTSHAQLTTSGPLLPPKYVDGVLVVVGNKVILRSELEENKSKERWTCLARIRMPLNVWYWNN